MSSNFDFIQDEWPHVYDSATQAEANIFQDPRTACFYARRALEHGVEWLYANDDYLQMPRHSQALGAMINERSFKENLDPGLMPKLVTIQQLGNIAVHRRQAIGDDYSQQSVKELFHFCYFLFRYYSAQRKKRQVSAFQMERVPCKRDDSGRSQKQLQSLQQQLEERDAEVKAEQEKNKLQQAELDKLRAEIQAIKAANKQAEASNPDPHDYNEAETREFLIDLLLAEAGWDLDAAEAKEYPLTGMPGGKNGRADYVLWGADGLPLALVEAKRSSSDCRVGQQQAKLYADCLEQMTGRRPLIFYSNGYEIYFWDDLNYPPRQVAQFYRPEALERLIHRRGQAGDLNGARINHSIVERHYQLEAVRRICENYQNKQRKALVVMATGTGKTRTAVALVELLMKQNWVQRVLFLADRNALVKQAQRAFKAHLPEASTWIVSNSGDDPAARVCFATYPTLLNSIENKRFGVGHFDLLIVDEAHRSVYQKYGAIFDYFDALLLGLTATPRDEVDRNTYQLFELEDGIPTFAYESEQAFADGYLVPPRSLSVPLKFQRQGIHYAELSAAEKEAYELAFENEDGSLPDSIHAASLNQWLFNQDTVDSVLKFLMEQGLKVEGGDTIGKTMIFARNHAHAMYIAERFDKNYPHYKGAFARVIDNYERFADDLIEQFSQPDKLPQIAISVDMLDTGIDVPEALNLVFFKTVYSRVKFFQMMGRGTRLCPDLFGPGQDKQEFLILDFCQNLEFFAHKPEGRQSAPGKSLSETLFIKRLKLAQRLQGQPDTDSQKLKAALCDGLHRVVEQMDTENFIVRTARRSVETFQQRDAWESLTTDKLHELSTQLAKLPTQYDLGTEGAKRFDNLVLSFQMALLEAQSTPSGSPARGLLTLREKLKDIASRLSGKASIPAVKAEMPLLEEMQGDAYWQDIQVAQVEAMRLRLRLLVDYLDKAQKQDTIYTHFKDEIGAAQEIAFTPFEGKDGMARYRHKIKAYLKANEDHIALQRLRHNHPMTPQDLQALEHMLFDNEELGDKVTFLQRFGEETRLGPFIRSLIGLDREAAKAAFNSFLQDSRYGANQIRFIDEIINALTRNGVMEVKRLYDPPYTHIHDESLDGLFSADEGDKIVEIITGINRNADITL